MELLKVLLMGIKRSKAKQEHVDARMAVHQCLIEPCERSSLEPGGGRGLCSMDFARFRRGLINLSFTEKKAIEMKEIKAGRLLESHECRKYKKSNGAPA